MDSIHRRVAAIALPMIISAITLPLLGLVDTFVLGHLQSEVYLAAVALGAMTVNLAIWLLGFLRMSTTGMVAQNFGAGEGAQMAATGLRAWLLALLLGVALALMAPLLSQLTLWLGQPETEVGLWASRYLEIRLLSAPAALSILTMTGFLLGRQQARATMLLMITNNGVNIVLDLWFVLGLQYGVAGAAWASVLADYAAALLGAYLCWPAIRDQLAGLTASALLERAPLMRLLRLNSDIFVRAALLQSCFAFMTLRGSHLGSDILAANAVLLNFLMLISYGLDGIAHAAEALFGAARGAADRVLQRRVVQATGLWTLLFALLFTLLFGLAGEHIIAALTDLVAIRTLAQAYLPYIIALPLLACWSFWFDGLFIGAAWGKAMRNSMALASLGVFYPCWGLLQGFGNHALWIAMLAFMSARGLSQALWFTLHWHKSQPGTAGLQGRA